MKIRRSDHFVSVSLSQNKMKITFKSLGFLFLFLSEFCWRLTSGSKKDYADPNLNSVQLIRKYGYPVESHVTRTEDGYLLELHRIPHGRHLEWATRRPPILLQHGFLGSSADFLLIGKKRALPLLLADAGYDVWLGNVRGNSYSRAHEFLSPDDTEFWNFSWYEMAIYDLPAQIDYVCNITLQNDIVYVGHSMGTTTFLAMAATRPEYQKKIRSAIFFAAIAYLKNVKTPLRHLAPLADDYLTFSEFFTEGELLQQSPILRFLIKMTCTLNSIERHVCRNLIFIFSGSDPFQFDADVVETLLYHMPAGGSTKTLTHYAQLVQSGEFRQFDYGPEDNKLKYNSTKPPGFNLEGIYTPLYIYEGNGDSLSTSEDVSRLVERLPNVRRLTAVDFPSFNHYDFIVAKDVKTLLYDEVIELIHSLTEEY